MLEIDLMPDHSEIVHYEQNEIPLYIRIWNLSAYPGMGAPCHWHEDLEWIHIMEGKMCYYVNGRRMVLHEKESLLVNARQMHYGYAYQKQECRFCCILFHPSLFCSNPSLQNKYVLPFLKNGSLEYLHFSASQQQAQEVADYLTQIVSLKEHAQEGYEWDAVALMHTLWGRLWQSGILKPAQDGQEAMQGDLAIQKTMVSSCSLLASTDKSITEIALACGFNHLSYYSKYFAESYGCTPREYRKQASAAE